MTLIQVYPDRRLLFAGRSFRCAIGRGGIRHVKTEGDGATPAGVFPLRRVLYRTDRIDAPATRLPAGAIAEDDGWCDAPGDPNYNRPVKRPYAARHERMWRDDGLYDLIVVLGHNDEPPTPGAGSAIFLHVASPDYGPTAGCIALALADLRSVLATCGPETRLQAHAPSDG